MAAKRYRLAQRRKTVGFTQEGLAERLGVDPKTVRRWESGETEDGPQPWLRPKLAHCLQMSVEQLEELLWFRLPDQKDERAVSEPAAGQLAPSTANSTPESLTRLQSNGAPSDSDTSNEHTVDPEHDPVLVAPWNHRGTVEAVVVLSGGDGRVKRRVFLSLAGPALTAPAHQWLVHEPEPLVSGLSGRRVSGALVSRFGTMLAELRQMDDLAGGGSVLAMAQQAFAWGAGLLDRASYDGRTGRVLHVVLAELGQLCGWLAYDAGDFGLAQRYYIAGLRAAHTADDRPLGAHILATMANQAARQGQPADAVTFVETALAGVRGRATPALLAELHFRQAYAFAALHDTSACTAAISQARTQVEQLKPDDDPPWLYWLDPAAIAVGAGNCCLLLGQPDQAATLLSEGIAQFSASFVRDRQLYVTRLAEARARPGKQRDLDAAAALGMESIDLAETLDSNTGADHLRDLYLHLKPHSTVPAVREFLERAKSVVEREDD